MKVLVDTSVVIDPSGAEWPDGAELAISTITVAELGFGIVKADDPVLRSVRTLRLQRVRSAFEVLPVDESVAEAYVAAATALYVNGRNPRARGFDLMIAATAMANEIPFYTRNFKDVATLRHLVDIRPV
ncbi:MAG: PIN domain-containing protein [Thermoleophilia bacterium]|nr:PIN domain-containing protein [Actinomycetota bacterium]MDP4667281.1 PIN domain-containing protein [Gaiellales bacterium]